METLAAVLQADFETKKSEIMSLVIFNRLMNVKDFITIKLS